MTSRLTPASGLGGARDSIAPHPYSLLWSPRVLARWAATVAVCALVVLGCWYTASGAVTWQEQRLPLSLSIAALVQASAAGLGLLLVGRRTVGLRRLHLLGELPLAGHAASVSAHATSDAPDSEVLVGGSGRVRYHRADCPMALGRNYLVTTMAEHQTAGRTACGVCRP